MQQNMPQYRYYIAAIERDSHILQEGIKNVTSCMEVLSDISSREVKGESNLSLEFQTVVLSCRESLELAIDVANHTLKNYDRLITFIDDEFRSHGGRNNNKKVDIYTLTKTVSNTSASTHGWPSFLRNSKVQWVEDKGILEYTLSHMARFGIALQAMGAKKIEGTDVTRELEWEEVSDRAALCSSFELVGLDVTGISDGEESRWVVATESDDGALYLSWYNSIRVK
jgi:hypothetical protein